MARSSGASDAVNSFSLSYQGDILFAVFLFKLTVLKVLIFSFAHIGGEKHSYFFVISCIFRTTNSSKDMIQKVHPYPEVLSFSFSTQTRPLSHPNRALCYFSSRVPNRLVSKVAPLVFRKGLVKMSEIYDFSVWILL